MGTYVSSIPTPPRVLTEKDQAAILKVTGEHRDGFRDHILVSMALATALRAHELLALDVGDIRNGEGRVRLRVVLTTFKRTKSGPAEQEIVLSEALRRKLDRYLTWKDRNGESVEGDAPLFVSRNHRRLSLRQLRHLFKVWQERAGIERPYTWHQLRHSSCTSLYRQTKDIRLVARFARHRSLASTERYTHPTIEDLVAGVQGLAC